MSENHDKYGKLFKKFGAYIYKSPKETEQGIRKGKRSLFAFHTRWK